MLQISAATPENQRLLQNRLHIRESRSSKPHIITVVLGVLALLASLLTICLPGVNALPALYAVASFAIFTIIVGGVKLYFNKTLSVHKKKREVALQHWLYHVVPHHWEIISWYRPWEYATWAVLGNDDDGIFGEEATSGGRWLARWGGKKNDRGEITDTGEISFKRFLCWNARNPLHNFTFYVIGFAGWDDIPCYRIALITSQTASFFKRQFEREMFPMGSYSGIYLGLHGLPGFSWRFNLSVQRRLEGYMGWRTRGSFGLALRVKHNQH